jgi:hypothetical protein
LPLQVFPFSVLHPFNLFLESGFFCHYASTLNITITASS